MSLRWKIILLVVAVFALDILVALTIERKVVYPSFLSLERQEATKGLSRCVEAIRRETDYLAVFCADWAAWDDTYRFVQDGNEEFRRNNLMQETFINSHIDLLCFCNTEGRIIWGQAYDCDRKQAVPLAMLAGPSIPREHAFLRAIGTGDAVRGLLLTERGPMLAVSRPVLTSNNNGPIRGVCVVGRMFDHKAICTIAEQMQVRFTAWPISDDPSRAIPAEERAVLEEIAAAGPVVLKEPGDALTSVYSTFPDLDGKPALLLKAEIPRAISARGRSAMQIAMSSSLAALVAITLLIWGVLEGMVVKPLARLTAHATRVGRSDNLAARLSMSRTDEIGVLANEFDRMVRHLAESRARLLEAAHRAGMAEIATNVLHNVGNAINTVGVSAELLGERAAQSRVESLGRVAALIKEHRDGIAAFLSEDEQGRKLVEYLPRLSETLAAERADLVRELGEMRDKVRHIRDIIESQQSIAAGPRWATEEDLGGVIREAIRLHDDLLRQRGVATMVHADGLPRVTVSRVKLLQVLENLIRNAVEAMTETAVADRRLTVRATAQGPDRVRIEISDTGVGFEPAERSRLFCPGYTTRPGGHGFGLHYCANAMTEMGGRVDARSDGRGRGATFILDLPIRANGAAPGPQSADSMRC